jgi:hypothetical protein
VKLACSACCVLDVGCRFCVNRADQELTEHYALCLLSLLCVDVVDAGSSIRLMGLPHLLVVVVAEVVAVNRHAVGSRYNRSRPVH